MTGEPTRPPVLVVGVGNEMRGDDAVGPMVLDRVRRDRRLDEEDVELAVATGEPTRLVELMHGRRLAVIVDAARSGIGPGTIQRLVVGTDPLPAPPGNTSSHGAGVIEAVELAGVLGRMPDQIVVLAVEVADLTMGAELSDPVRNAIPTVVDMVTAEART